MVFELSRIELRPAFLAMAAAALEGGKLGGFGKF